jgi:hypothetical protein
MHAYHESVEDLEPLVTWGQSVLSATDTSNPPLDAKMVTDAAVFLRPYVSIGLLTFSDHGITTKLIGLIVASPSLVLK